MNKNSKICYKEQQKSEVSKKFADFANSENYQSGIYEGALTKMEFICPAGHSFDMIPNNFKQGRRCPTCGKEKRKKTIKINMSKELSDIATRENYQVEGEYINSVTKMQFTCDKKHTFNMTPNDFKKGIRCPVCAIERISSASAISARKRKASAAIVFAKLVASKGHITLSAYDGAHKVISFLCDAGHSFNATPSNFKHGGGCPECNKEKRRIKNQKILDLACSNKNIVRKSTFTCMLDKHQFECLICNNKWDAKANSIAKTLKGCSECKVRPSL